jgi:hypothetical protein
MSMKQNEPAASDIIIQPKRPAGGAWRLFDRTRILGFPAERWVSVQGHVAISAVEVATGDGEPLGPEYHVSFSYRGGRVPADDMPRLLKLWDMEGADEDNHVGGVARNFWKPVAGKLVGYICPCKDTEHAITEGDFVWRPL